MTHAPGPAAAHPLPVAGGITALSGDGEGGGTWWSKRFVQLLESFGVGSRLERGRSYARGGQVTELEVEPGIVLAKVQGTRYTPYRVRIRARLLSDDQWELTERAMAEQALVLAQLLAGRMPADIEQLLQTCDLTLFPPSYADLKASCECPDATNPCKHIAAVYYVLAERFDADPFEIFTWRGRTPEELLSALRARRANASPNTELVVAVATVESLTPTPTAASFWQTGPELADLQISPLAGEAPDALLRGLGPAPVDAQGRNVLDVLTDIHVQLSTAAERRALAE